MSRLQALLLALELSAMVWIGMLICGRWVVEQGETSLDFEVTSSVR